MAWLLGIVASSQMICVVAGFPSLFMDIGGAGPATLSRDR